VIASRGDSVAVLEAAYAGAADHATWAARVIDAIRPLVGGRAMIGMTGIRHTDERAVLDPAMTAGALLPAGPTASFAELDVDAAKALYYPPAVALSHTELEPLLEPSLRDLVRVTRDALGVADCIGLLFHPAPRTAVGLWVGCDERVRLDRLTRRRLTQLALHIEAGLRIRLHPESVVAILEPDGRIVHREPVALDAASVTARVTSIERARTRRHRTDWAALDLWPALISGRLSVVERREGARRYYALVENPPSRWPLRSLTRGELDALSHASRGLSSKLIAYALGISPPTVSSRLASAASKVGAASRVELVRIGALLTRDPRATIGDEALTAAERDVLVLVERGLSNAAIARTRNRSIRTIANQVAELLRKTGSATRRELVARTLRSSAS
jgi:DNA-binding CsgD family transcriptional regulator